jgi:hypothetical protein
LASTREKRPLFEQEISPRLSTPDRGNMQELSPDEIDVMSESDIAAEVIDVEVATRKAEKKHVDTSAETFIRDRDKDAVIEVEDTDTYISPQVRWSRVRSTDLGVGIFGGQGYKTPAWLAFTRCIPLERAKKLMHVQPELPYNRTKEWTPEGYKVMGGIGHKGRTARKNENYYIGISGTRDSGYGMGKVA